MGWAARVRRSRTVSPRPPGGGNDGHDQVDARVGRPGAAGRRAHGRSPPADPSARARPRRRAAPPASPGPGRRRDRRPRPPRATSSATRWATPSPGSTSTKPGSRRVVRRQHARGAGAGGGVGRRRRRDPGPLAEHLGQVGDVDATEPQHLRPVTGQVDDRRLDPDRARPTVEHQVDVVAEVGADVGGGRRAHPAEPVGGRRGDGRVARAQAVDGGEQRQRHRDGPARAGRRSGAHRSRRRAPAGCAAARGSSGPGQHAAGQAVGRLGHGVGPPVEVDGRGRCARSADGPPGDP